MTKSNGIASLKQAARLLNKHSPDGESLAYINPREARLLKAHGGSGITTLQGVPSYAHDADWWNPFDWHWTGDEGIIQKGKEFFGYGKQKVLDRDGNLVEVAGRSPFQDAIAVYAALRAKKDQEGLNEAEMSEFNRLNAQLTAGKQEFTGYTGGGEHLTAPTNVPETKEDVSVFKETTGRPDMITTATPAEGGRIGYNEGSGKTYKNWLDYRLQQIAKGLLPVPFELWKEEKIDMAQGGRIGAFNGGIQGLMPQQGMPQQGFMPQPGLDPRMGYQVGSSDIPGIPGVGKAMRDVDFPTFSEGVNQEFPSNELGAIDTTVQEDVSTTGGNKIQETVMSLINSRIVGDTQEALEHARILNEYEINSPGVTDLALSLINSRIVGDVREAIEQALIIMKASQTQGNAYGGRIGAQGGGIMPLLDMGGMEKDYRQDGGFVPIGRKEKADDVPARLSKNEFVFTADAVKAAGGGDIDEGAQRMYNVMKNLEAGGEISEQSQGQA